MFQSISVAGVQSLSIEGLDPRPNHAIITVEGAAIRFRVDGVTPTVGHRVAPGGVIVLEGTNELVGFRAIGPGALLVVTYSRVGVRGVG